MRTKEELFQFEEVTLLWQYLYMDKENYFIVNNGLADLKFYMDDKYYIWSINMNYPDVPPMVQELQPNNWLGIIDKLKEAPPIKCKWFKTAWEEIKAVTGEAVALNHMKSKCREI